LNTILESTITVPRNLKRFNQSYGILHIKIFDITLESTVPRNL